MRQRAHTGKHIERVHVRAVCVYAALFLSFQRLARVAPFAQPSTLTQLVLAKSSCATFVLGLQYTTELVRRLEGGRR